MKQILEISLFDGGGLEEMQKLLNAVKDGSMICELSSSTGAELSQVIIRVEVEDA